MRRGYADDSDVREKSNEWKKEARKPMAERDMKKLRRLGKKKAA